MKKIFLFVIIVSIPIFSVAQDKNASIGFGIGAASVSIKNSEFKNWAPGISYYLNGMYNINEQFSAGIEYNGTLFYNSNNTYELERANGFFARGKYNFNSTSVIPYFGILLGATGYNSGYEQRFAFGFAPEFGIQFNSFQLSTLCHIAGKYSTSFTPSIPTSGENLVIWQVNFGWNIGIGNK